MENLLELFKRCLNADYKHTEIGGSYAIKPYRDTLYIFFQESNGLTDWIFNLFFPRRKRRPYENMDEPWLTHGGFLRVWDSIKPHLESAVSDPKYKKIVIAGYSHGAAMALLCHEYVWFNRPDLRDNLFGYGFGAPRVFGGELTDSLAERWKNFHIVQNHRDIVASLPPKFLGFKDVGQLIAIGGEEALNPIDAHRAESYISSLERMEKKLNS